MNRQQMFDNACKLISQGKPAIADDCVCAYRGTDNTCCALGWSIPDDKYDEKFEGNVPGERPEPVFEHSPNSPLARLYEVLDLRTYEDVKFAQALQACHDDSHKSSNFQHDVAIALRQFAKCFNLDLSTWYNEGGQYAA